jgi:hypothetical protein
VAPVIGSVDSNKAEGITDDKVRAISSIFAKHVGFPINLFGASTLLPRPKPSSSASSSASSSSTVTGGGSGEDTKHTGSSSSSNNTFLDSQYVSAATGKHIGKMLDDIAADLWTLNETHSRVLVEKAKNLNKHPVCDAQAWENCSIM